MWCRTAALGCLALAACNTTQKHCEHARDVIMGEAERDMNAALEHADPQARAQVEGRARAQLDTAKSSFVAHCMALDEDGKKCIARVDELDKLDTVRRKAVEACRDNEHDAPDMACQEEATRAAEASAAGSGLEHCWETLDAFSKKLYGES
jgi:hypothetical protein